MREWKIRGAATLFTLVVTAVSAFGQGGWLDYMPDDSQSNTAATKAAATQSAFPYATRQTVFANNSATASALSTQCHAAYLAHRYDLALNLCQRAVDMGDSDATMGVAAIYRLGLKQCSRAAPYYVMQKDAHPLAAIGLGEMYWLGCPDFPINHVKARELFQSAANRGYSAGWEDLGWMDELGLGAPHDRQKAIRDFTEAARSGNDWANDLMIALKGADRSRRFGSPEELGQYAADVRFSRALGAYQRDLANQPRPAGPHGAIFSCPGGGMSIGVPCLHPLPKD
jgi:TPR repeat protein